MACELPGDDTSGLDRIHLSDLTNVYVICLAEFDVNYKKCNPHPPPVLLMGLLGNMHKPKSRNIK